MGLPLGLGSQKMLLRSQLPPSMAGLAMFLALAKSWQLARFLQYGHILTPTPSLEFTRWDSPQITWSTVYLTMSSLQILVLWHIYRLVQEISFGKEKFLPSSFFFGLPCHVFPKAPLSVCLSLATCHHPGLLHMSFAHPLIQQNCMESGACLSMGLGGVAGNTKVNMNRTPPLPSRVFPSVGGEADT